MAKRVFAELGRWTTIGDAELTADIARIDGRSPPPELLAPLLAQARRLFAKALDTPGGLKIQTIHAFCERLLHQFPFEANVAGHFEVLDERNAVALKEEARRAVLARAAAGRDTVLGAALEAVLARVSDRTHDDSLKEFIEDGDAVGAWIVERGSLDRAIADLRRVLALAPGETAAGLRRSVIDGMAFTSAEVTRLLAELRQGKPRDVSAAGRLTPFIESEVEDVRVDAWFDLFFTNGDLRAAVATKGIRDAWPGLEERLAVEGERLVALLDRIRTADLFETTAAMLRLADGAIAEYDRLKRQRGVLDFEDLVVRTAALLARADASRWVHYKLDQGLDHILVDEAQDTSPRQWQVICALAEEFFAGEGAGSGVRTLFAVGDEKQSIFSFQGAVPAWFSRVQRELGVRARAATYQWEDLELHLSFRSVPKILAAVDAVFAAPQVHAGLTAEARPTVHSARRRNDPGRVVVWPRYEAPKKADADDWVQPLDRVGLVLHQLAQVGGRGAHRLLEQG
jgi:ATP-dependent helicase/nuclease subunit A